MEVRLLTPITLEFNEAVQSGKGLVVIEPLGLNGTRYELTTAGNQVKMARQNVQQLLMMHCR